MRKQFAFGVVWFGSEWTHILVSKSLDLNTPKGFVAGFAIILIAIFSCFQAFKFLAKERVA